MDTTDEPATSACSNIITERSFFCGAGPADEQRYRRGSSSADRVLDIAGYPYFPKEVYSSRVHDGVCDCCDGSDEAGNPHLQRKCVNVCALSIVLHNNRNKQQQQVRRGASSKYYEQARLRGRGKNKKKRPGSR